MSSTILFLIFLFLGPFSGGMIGLFVGKNLPKKYLKIWLAFSGAYLLALAMSNLMPHVFHEDYPHTGAFLLAGFLFQIILDYYSKGADHGHIHIDSHSHHEKNTVPHSLLAALCLHSFIEGIPLGSDIMGTESDKWSFLWGISLHELPPAFVLISIYKSYAVKSNSIIFIIILYALMAPLGFSLSYILENGNILPEHILHYLLAIVTGTFLHISTTIIFESSENHRFNSVKLMMIILGISLALLMTE